MAELALIGTLVSAAGQVVGGINANNAAKAEAAQLEMQGKEEFAAGQRDAMAKRREGQLLNSRVQSLAAASGAGADSPTIVRLMAGTASEAELNAGTAMYGATARRRGAFDRATASRASGQSSLLGSMFGAAGSALGGANSYGTAKGYWG